MAELNHLGNVIAVCPGCNGAKATYEWRSQGSQFGIVRGPTWTDYYRTEHCIDWVLMRCGGCGRGGLAAVESSPSDKFPNSIIKLRSFAHEVKSRVLLPGNVPKGIEAEFREAEKCFDAGAFRAAAGMFRSVLDKALRANGYKLKPGTTLEQQIDMAAADGVITAARKRKAHDEIRVLGNDVLHDDWHEVAEVDVRAACHYAQRILEDLYDDRESVLKLLSDAGRVLPEAQVASPAPPAAADAPAAHVSKAPKPIQR